MRSCILQGAAIIRSCAETVAIPAEIVGSWPAKIGSLLKNRFGLESVDYAATSDRRNHCCFRRESHHKDSDNQPRHDTTRSLCCLAALSLSRFSSSAATDARGRETSHGSRAEQQNGRVASSGIRAALHAAARPPTSCLIDPRTRLTILLPENPNFGLLAEAALSASKPRCNSTSLRSKFAIRKWGYTICEDCVRLTKHRSSMLTVPAWPAAPSAAWAPQ